MTTSPLRAALLALSLTLPLVPATVVAQDVTGAGATFPAPIYAKWADAYNKATGARINYQSVGSGAGIRQIKAYTVEPEALDRFDAVALGYCLMGNHYHFVLRTHQPNLSRLMRQVNGVYTQAIYVELGKPIKSASN